MALIFDGSNSIPLSLTRKPNNFLAVTPKVHFCGFNLNLYSFILSNNILKLTMWPSLSLDYMIMSLTYTLTSLCIMSCNKVLAICDGKMHVCSGKLTDLLHSKLITCAM